MTLLILINIKNNTKSSQPSIYYYNASSVTLHRTPTIGNAAKIDTNVIWAQFDATEDLEGSRMYDPMTGMDSLILSVL